MTTTIGSIAITIINSFASLPANLSGTMVDTVDNARIEVSNYTGNTIGSNSVDDKYKSVITNLAKANVYEQLQAENPGTASIQDLSYTQTNFTQIGQNLRNDANNQLKMLGMDFSYKKTYV